jgi:hypothetical protein
MANQFPISVASQVNHPVLVGDFDLPKGFRSFLASLLPYLSTFSPLIVSGPRNEP